MKLMERIRGFIKSLFLMFFILPITLLNLVGSLFITISEYNREKFNPFMVIFNGYYREIYLDNFVLVGIYFLLTFYFAYILVSMFFQTKKAMKRVSKDNGEKEKETV